MNGNQNMQVRKNLLGLSFACEKVLQHILFFIEETLEPKEKEKQSGIFFWALKKTAHTFSKGVQHITSLDCEKLWSTNNMQKMRTPSTYWPIHQLG